MAPEAFFYPLLLATLTVVCLIIHVWWPDPRRATPPSPFRPVQPRPSAPKSPNSSPGISKNRYVRLVSTAPIHILKPPDPHRHSSSSTGADGVPSRRRVISVPIRTAPIAVGSAWAISAPMAIPVVNPGVGLDHGFGHPI
jgi:hypothetical protein